MNNDFDYMQIRSKNALVDRPCFQWNKRKRIVLRAADMSDKQFVDPDGVVRDGKEWEVVGGVEREQGDGSWLGESAERP